MIIYVAVIFLENLGSVFGIKINFVLHLKKLYHFSINFRIFHNLKTFQLFQILIVDDDEDWASARSTTQSELLKAEKHVRMND